MKHTRKKPEGRRRVLVYGTVQGVGFRYFVRQAARALHLAGYVLNRPDGTVEFEAEGDEDAVRRLLHTVEHGPSLGHVERTELIDSSAGMLPLPFEIRRWYG